MKSIVSSVVSSVVPFMFDNSPKSWAQALRIAADKIAAQSVLAKNCCNLTTPDGEVCDCAGSALGKVLAGRKYSGYSDYSTHASHAPSEVHNAAQEVLGRRGGDGISFIASWNDREERTKEEVVSAFRAIADKLDPAKPHANAKGKRFSSSYQPSEASKAKRMSHVFRRRLLKLADVTETKAIQGRFWFGSYVGGQAQADIESGWKGKADLSCGTSACAMGWGTTIPSLRKAGLRMVKDFSFDSLSPKHCTFAGKVGIVGKDGELLGSWDDGSDIYAGRVLFGLSRVEYMALFIPDAGSYTATVNRDLHISLCDTVRTSSGTVIAERIRTFANAKYPAKTKRAMAKPAQSDTLSEAAQ